MIQLIPLLILHSRAAIPFDKLVVELLVQVPTKCGEDDEVGRCHSMHHPVWNSPLVPVETWDPNLHATGYDRLLRFVYFL